MVVTDAWSGRKQITTIVALGGADHGVDRDEMAEDHRIPVIPRKAPSSAARQASKSGEPAGASLFHPAQVPAMALRNQACRSAKRHRRRRNLPNRFEIAGDTPQIAASGGRFRGNAATGSE